MWMDAYVQEILIREQLATDRKRAVSDHLHARAKAVAASGRPARPRAARAPFIPRLARQLVRMATQ